MIFTDEDLKRLKDGDYELFGYSKNHLEALIVRLEAAERALDAVCGPQDDVFIKQFEVWMKAAGK